MKKSEVQQYWSKANNWEAFKNSYFSEDDTTKPHLRSKWLVEVFKDLEIRSVLEIGSNCGRNLYHLKKIFPDLEVAGIDINAQAIEFSKTKVEGYFVAGSIYDLDKLIKKEYDLAFSVATLCYIQPDYLDEVLDRIVKLTKKHVYHFEKFGKGEVIQGATPSQNTWFNDIEGYYQRKGLSYERGVVPESIGDETTMTDILRCNL